MNESRIFSIDAIPAVATQDLRGGKGTVLCRWLLGAENAVPGSPFTKSAVNILEPGSSIGLHRHVGDAEVYVIISGSGTYSYTDGGQTVRKVKVKAGDMTVCYNGEEHGLENDGTEPMMMAGVIA